MLTIPQDIPDFVLSSQLDNFTISADKRVTFVLKQANTVILQETYTQDASNQIHILDLFSLMEPYLIGSPMLQFSYEVSASSAVMPSHHPLQRSRFRDELFPDDFGRA